MVSDAQGGNGLEQWLRSTVDEVAEQRGARKLARALSLAEGFVLALVTCESTRAAAALQLWLRAELERELGRAVVVDRLSPYPLDPRSPGPAQLGVRELGELVLLALVDEGRAPGQFVFVDAARANEAQAEAWRSLFLRLNERRNLIVERLGGPLILILAQRLEADLPRLAPDLWSVRSVDVRIEDRGRGLELGPRLVESYEIAGRTAEDVRALARQVEELRPRAQAGTPEARRALRVLLLRLAGAQCRVGELDEAGASIEEAREIAAQLGDRSAEAACQIARSDLLVVRGELDLATRLVEEAITTLLKTDDDWTLANGWDRLADILERRGELDEALRIRREETLPIFDRLGDERERAVMMGKVANILAMRGELDEALRIRREEELPVYERLGDVHARAATMGRIADILAKRGELDEALRIRREEELPVYERLGGVHARAVTMGRVADILEKRGELDEALRLRREEELPVYERLGDVRELLIGRIKLAITLGRRGRPEDRAEVEALLAQALRAARRLRIPEVATIVTWVRSLGFDPDAPPFVDAGP